MGVMALTLIVALVIIIWKVYHMREALGQVGDIFSIIKNKPNLSGLLQAGKAAQKLPTTVSAGPRNKEVPIESSIKPEVAIPLYQATGEEFTSEKQMKKYLSKMKKIKGVSKSTDYSKGVTTDTT